MNDQNVVREHGKVLSVLGYGVSLPAEFCVKEMANNIRQLIKNVWHKALNEANVLAKGLRSECPDGCIGDCAWCLFTASIEQLQSEKYS